MARKKVGVYLSESSTSILERYKEEEDNVSTSGTINAILERYAWACRASLPDLSVKEWQMILNVYAGSELSSYNPPYRIASDMMDDLGEIDLAALEKTRPDYAALVKKIHELSQAEQLAVIDFSQRFWSRDWSDSDFDTIKEELSR